MKQRVFAVRCVYNPQGKPVAYFPYREWLQADLLAARLSGKDKNRLEYGSHYVNVVKVPEGKMPAMCG